MFDRRLVSGDSTINLFVTAHEPIGRPNPMESPAECFQVLLS
jgi:hypothetical protein